MEISDGLDLSTPLIILKNQAGVSSTMDTVAVNSVTSLSCHTTATARLETGLLITSEEGLVLTHNHES